MKSETKKANFKNCTGDAASREKLRQAFGMTPDLAKWNVLIITFDNDNEKNPIQGNEEKQKT